MFSILFALSALPQVSVPAPKAPVVSSAPTLHWFDLEGDGDLDVLSIGGGSVQLLRNDGAGPFLDVSASAGLDQYREVDLVLAGDLDLDNRTDLVLAGVGGVRLLQQVGEGFVDVSKGFGLPELPSVTALAWVDANADERPDLHVVAAGSHRVFTVEASGGFVELDLGLTTLDPRQGLGAPGRDDVDSEADAGELGDDRRRDRAHGVGPQGTGLATPPPGAVSGTSGPPALDVLGCVRSLADQDGGACIEASRRPELGSLYPLSERFYVDPNTGFVGIGTVSPSNDLTVVGAASATSVQATLMTAVQLEAVNVIANNDLEVGGSITAGSNHSVGSVDVDGVGILAGTSHQIGVENSMFGGRTGNSAILSGWRNMVESSLVWSAPTGQSSVIGGGSDNVIRSQAAATIAGGASNRIEASGSVTLGSQGASIGGGTGNRATGFDATIPGGTDNLASGAESFAAGRTAEALHDNTFVWSSTSGAFHSTASGQFLIDAPSGVGIGTNLPIYALDVQGDDRVIRALASDGIALVVSGSGSSGVGVRASGAQNAGIFVGEVDVIDGSDVTSTGGGFLQIGNDTSSNIAIDDNEIMARSNGSAAALNLNIEGGNVILGSTDPGRVGVGTSSPLAKFQVDGTTTSDVFRARVDGATRLVLDGNGGFVVGANTTPGFDLLVSGNGAFGGTAAKPGGGSWSVSSDRRLKKNIEDLDGALDDLLALRGVTYEYKDPEAIGELAGVRTGFIAQEVEEVFPDWVDQHASGMRFLSIRGFEALTVEALRELRAEKDAEIAERDVRIEDGISEIAALRARVADLEQLERDMATLRGTVSQLLETRAHR